MQTIALWCGIAGIISSVLAIIIIFLVRKHIVDILDKDAILFDGSFSVKKEAIAAALNLIDHISSKGKQITFNPEFAMKAKHCYNDLLCVVSNMNIAQEFFNIALDTSIEIAPNQILNFKLLCRQDIGLKTKRVKLLVQNNNASKTNTITPANSSVFEEDKPKPSQQTRRITKS